MDRLFVPLNSEPYEWFKSGRKKYELRRYGGQWTEKRLSKDGKKYVGVWTGRMVELKYGYSGESIWGNVGNVLIGTINDIISNGPYDETIFGKDGLEVRKVGYKGIIPTANSKEEFIETVKKIMDEGEKYIAFEVVPKT